MYKNGAHMTQNDACRQVLIFAHRQDKNSLTRPVSIEDSLPDRALPITAKTLNLTLKVPNKNCSRQHFDFLLLSFEVIRLHVLCESSALQRIHMKY